jgi:hypothetical protein
MNPVPVRLIHDIAVGHGTDFKVRRHRRIVAFYRRGSVRRFHYGSRWLARPSPLVAQQRVI